MADCSVTGIRAMVPSGGVCPGPLLVQYANREKPASNSILLVTGAVQVACVT